MLSLLFLFSFPVTVGSEAELTQLFLLDEDIQGNLWGKNLLQEMVS